MVKQSFWNTIRSSALFNGPSDPELYHFLEESTPVERTLSRGSVLLNEGEQNNALHLVCSGKCQGEKYHYHGEIHLVTVYTAGDIINLECAVSRSQLSPLTVVARGRCQILSFGYEQLKRSVFNVQLLQNLTYMMADESIRRLQKIDILSHNGIRDRALAYFYIMDQRSGGAPFHTNMTQEQLARFLSVNRSSLSSELNAMRREGIIDFERDQFHLLLER